MGGTALIYFKNPQGNVFAYDSQAERDQFGAPDLVAMNPAEIAAHLALSAPSGPTPAQQIDALERQYMLPRPVRDVLLGVMEKEAAAAGYTPAQLRLANPGYRRVKELDEQIAALRAQV